MNEITITCADSGEVLYKSEIESDCFAMPVLAGEVCNPKGDLEVSKGEHIFQGDMTLNYSAIVYEDLEYKHWLNEMFRRKVCFTEKAATDAASLTPLY